MALFFTTAVAPQTVPALPLSTLTISELDALYDALLAAEDALAASTNSPRIQGTVIHTHLSARFESLAAESDAIIAELAARHPAGRWESQQRAERLIMHACRCGESAADIAKLAQDLGRPDTH